MSPPSAAVRRRILIGLSLVVLVTMAAWLGRGGEVRSFTAVPLAQSAYLRDVVEPITIEMCMSFDDGGSQGILFRDARRQRFGACLESDWGSPNGDGGNGMTLALGDMNPGRGQRVPVRGPEEQAFIGLLERWSLSDPDALVWIDRASRWRQAVRDTPRLAIFDGHETPEQMAKAHGVFLLQRLLRQ